MSKSIFRAVVRADPARAYRISDLLAAFDPRLASVVGPGAVNISETAEETSSGTQTA